MPTTQCDTCGISSIEVTVRDDGQITCDSCVECFYGMTIHRGRGAGSYATKKQARAAVLRELRLWRHTPTLATTAKRRCVANRILANSSAIRPKRGMVLFAWAQEVALDALVGDYDLGDP